MKILIICSKQFYFKINEIKEKLEKRKIEVYLPNCYDDPKTEERMWKLGKKDKIEGFAPIIINENLDLIKEK